MNLKKYYASMPVTFPETAAILMSKKDLRKDFNQPGECTIN